MSTDEYVPSEEFVREQYSREQPPHIGTVSEKRAEFDRFLARVRRDAWQGGYATGFRDALTVCEIVTGMEPGPLPGPTANPYKETP